MKKFDPVPMMSTTAVDFITNKIVKPTEKKKIIVEYGSGMSTLFFLNKLIDAKIKCKYIAVERNFAWYERIRSEISAELVEKKKWGLKFYLKYLFQPSTISKYIPKQYKRLPHVKRRMLKRLPAFLMLKRMQEKFGQRQALFKNYGGYVDFDYFYAYEDFKDQYGESPSKFIYIKYPLTDLITELQSGSLIEMSVIIDGGPRLDIVRYMYSFPNLSIEIFLLEAGRGFYSSVINAQPTGRFIAARENKLINGEKYLDINDNHNYVKFSNYVDLLDPWSLEYALSTELWYFRNK